MSLSITATAGLLTLLSANVNVITLELGKRATLEECNKVIDIVAQQFQTCIPTGKTAADADLTTAAYAQCVCPVLPLYAEALKDAQCTILYQDNLAKAGTIIGATEWRVMTNEVDTASLACARGLNAEAAQLLRSQQIVENNKSASPTAIRPAAAVAPSATQSSANPSGPVTGKVNGGPSGGPTTTAGSTPTGGATSGASTLSISAVARAAVAAAGIVFFVV
ncbi:hypothetical protein DFS34DRAFT_89890 [Phlyctochytrium arcticum]|nr:hypothetical protein DFS34DRAFT_89890 [Phlyctochytrium arcticum]